MDSLMPKRTNKHMPSFGVRSVSQYSGKKEWLYDDNNKLAVFSRADAIDQAKILNKQATKNIYWEAVPVRKMQIQKWS